MGILQTVFDKSAGVVYRLEDGFLRDGESIQNKGVLRGIFTLAFLRQTGSAIAELPFMAACTATKGVAKVTHTPLNTFRP